jgi:hypothetical protein
MNPSPRLLVLFGFAVFTASLRADDAQDFIETAVLQGLKTERMPRATAKTLLETHNNWVEKCRICDACKRGFATYINETTTGHSTMTKETQAKLESKSRQVRLSALNQLIRKYIDNGLSQSQLTTKQRQLLMETFKAMKRETDNLLITMTQEPDERHAAVGFCAVCEGVCLLDVPLVVTEIAINFKQGGCPLPSRAYALRVFKDGHLVIDKNIVMAAVKEGEEKQYSFTPVKKKLSLEGKYKVDIRNGTGAQPGPIRAFWTVNVVDAKGINHPLIERVLVAAAPFESGLVEAKAGDK